MTDKETDVGQREREREQQRKGERLRQKDTEREGEISSSVTSIVWWRLGSTSCFLPVTVSQAAV